jgi:hypothetical protein
VTENMTSPCIRFIPWGKTSIKPAPPKKRRFNYRPHRPVAQRIAVELPAFGHRTQQSLERFRTSTKYLPRPAAADIAFCVAGYANGMTEDRIERALEDDYLSRDPSTSKQAAYIRRTMEKARRWAAQSRGHQPYHGRADVRMLIGTRRLR